MCAKNATMILGMEVVSQVSFDQKRDLSQPNPWLNIPVRCCSAVAVSTWCIILLGMIVFQYFQKTEISWNWEFQTAVRCLLWDKNPFLSDS